MSRATEFAMKLLQIICRAMLRVFSVDCYWLW